MPVRIGVVDTGVDAAHPLFKRKSPRGIGIRREASGYQYEPDYHDLLGHGTAMALLIQAFCRQARICAVRIAQSTGNGSTPLVQEEVLAMGIEWCVDQGIRIVNVSYSIAGAAEDGFLARACRKAHERNVILVAAYRNGATAPVYPATFPTVIGVRRHSDLREPGQISILSEENHDLWAWGSSNSIAAAQVSAMVGRIHTVDDSFGVEEVFGLLREVAVP